MQTPANPNLVKINGDITQKDFQIELLIKQTNELISKIIVGTNFEDEPGLLKIVIHINEIADMNMEKSNNKQLLLHTKSALENAMTLLTACLSTNQDVRRIEAETSLNLAVVHKRLRLAATPYIHNAIKSLGKISADERTEEDEKMIKAGQDLLPKTPSFFEAFKMRFTKPEKGMVKKLRG